MIERIIENWLTKVNEKSFQIPFCQMLTAEGYKVVHLSRHGPFEEGKDIIAIAPDNTPCAFQLKGSEGGRITQREWAKYDEQIRRLVEIPIKHPSINEASNRRVFFVTNGELDEEVRVQITNENPERVRRKFPILNTILKGELLTRFTEIHSNLWPIQLQSEKTLLELYLADGSGYLDKPKFAEFLESLILSSNDSSTITGQRVLASAALFASYALFPFSQSGNYLAIIEGWMIYLAAAMAYIEKTKLKKKFWKNTIELAEQAIEIALMNLWEEVKDKDFLVAGNPLVDAPFYRGRFTWILGMISAIILLQHQNTQICIESSKIIDYIFKNLNLLELWGEAVIPQLLSIIWALRSAGFTQRSNQLLFEVYSAILEKSNSSEGCPDPYHNLGDVVLRINGLADNTKKESFGHRSYSLNSILQLIVSRDFRGVVSDTWKKVSNLQLTELKYDFSWNYCLWNCDNGSLQENMPKCPQSWKDLVNQSKIIELEMIPNYFQSKPAILQIFLMVYPHRLQPDVIKFLDNSFK